MPVQSSLVGCVAPFVASPEYRVRRFVELAGIDSDDVLMDIGCGDGSLLAAARRLCGCRGLGTDIDTELVALARRTYAGDPGLVFEVSDLTEVGFSLPKHVPVAVVYLLPSQARETLTEILRQAVADGTLRAVIALRWSLQTQGLHLEAGDAEIGVYVYTCK